jgi:hypothetical protein
MHHAITTIPWGDDEGLPVLHLRGSVASPAEADELVDDLERRYEHMGLGGTLVELDRYDTAAHAALLIALNSSGRLAPVCMFGKPGDAWPAAPVTIGLDVSEFFAGLPADLAAWAEDLYATAQRCPRVAELLVKTEVAPSPEMLGHAFSAFAVQSGTLHVPERIATAATIAAARSGYAWKVRVRP